ncbi:MAG: DUF3592 domain-containing protein [Verrucomicrobia bacterium]|nr:MAG: DUF3592 domain-containing protein [Verrucomicrobiota bacterium]TAE88472.1 MAG: DUF3592 domain-containing protein [Verrucomicrobiota bacterium]TAF26927.1 MAG: DUF3592 domain-containing protein [Verrucomicrobiota bacterium]TAF42183.1 MAG: DUF3592 domain-containing protein [Verrucomicrobiota bacterium]
MPRVSGRQPGLIVFGLIWTAFSSVFVVLGLSGLWKAVTVSGWERVPCEIERFEIRANAGKTPAFAADLRFHYEFDGRKYHGSHLWLEKEDGDDYEDLAEIREKFFRGAAGRQIECRVNPERPVESALLGSNAGQILGASCFVVFGLFFVMIGVGLLRLGFKSGGARARSAGSSSDAPPFVTTVFFLFFAVAGLGLLGGLILPKALDWASMQRWKSVDAEVIWSRVKHKSGSDGATYAVDLFYRYEFDGREYRSNRYDILGGSSSGRSGKEAIVKAHPAKSRLEVFVNPVEPWHAVVKRDLGWWGWFALFPLPFLGIGFGGLWWMLRRKGRSPARSETTPPSGRFASSARGQGKSSAVAVSGEWMAVGGGRVKACLGLLFAALFWNGVVSFGVRDAFGGLAGASWIDRISGGGLGLFMIPFVVVGFGLVIATLYTFVAIFGPRYEIQLAEASLKPGKSTIVQWRRVGGWGQPRDFVLLLVGREEATWSQGSSRSTARSVFYEQLLFETTVPLSMLQGRVELRIPDDGVPGFQGRHNKLFWLLSLRAGVPWLPDLRADREFAVVAPTKEELP